jgi:Ca2+-binding RTX toxin-like protein
MDKVCSSVSYTLGAGQEIETLQTTNNALTTALMLTGNEFANTIIGNAGANVLNGGAGVDTMFGFGGNDTYYVDNAADVVNEDPNDAVGGSNDRVLTTVSYVLKAGSGVETLQTSNNALATPLSLTGNEQAQTIIGNAGANVINGGAGADEMFGFGGSDTYLVDNANDGVNEAANGGTDRVLTSVSYALEAGQSIETLQTTNNALTGALHLTGNEIANTIVGNAGANTIDGKAGSDTLFGFSGADRFLFTTALNASTNVDTIADYQHGADKIGLAHAIFGTLPVGALAASAFTTAAPVNADQHVIYNTSTGAISYDDDGNGAHAAIQFATITGHPQINSGDFFVV